MRDIEVKAGCTIGEFILLLKEYSADDLVQLDFDTTNFNILKSSDRTTIATLLLPTEYEFREKGLRCGR